MRADFDIVDAATREHSEFSGPRAEARMLLAVARQPASPKSTKAVRAPAGTSKARRRAGRAKLTLTPIVEAAAKMLDEEGLAAFSMRRLAAELGSGVMSLYWYVDSKEELLALVVDEVLSSVRLPKPGGDWEKEIRRYARETHALLRDHPGLGLLLSEGVSLGPNVLSTIEAVLSVLRSAGLSQMEAVDGFFAITTLITHLGAGTQGQSGGSGTSWRDWSRLDSLPADLYPNVVSAAQVLATRIDSGAFDAGLDTLLAGLRLQVEARNARRPGPRRVRRT